MFGSGKKRYLGGGLVTALKPTPRPILYVSI